MRRSSNAQLCPGQHKLEDLARLIVSNSQLRGPRLTSLQKSALKDFRRVKIVPAGTSTNEIAKIYMPIFDRLFFLGTLQGHVSISPSGQFSNTCYGYTDDISQDQAQIVVHTLFEDGETRVLKHIATILHEMIHAFLFVYMHPQYLESPNFHGDGYTGHGESWQDIAYALDKATSDPGLLNMKLQMGRDTALKGEMRKTSERIDPARWGLDLSRNRTPADQFCSRAVRPVQLPYRPTGGTRRPSPQNEPARRPENFQFQSIPGRIPGGWVVKLQGPRGQTLYPMMPAGKFGRRPMPVNNQDAHLGEMMNRIQKFIFGE
jgi:hypothetical protein